ncbi:MAG: phage baseplate assembly protein V [Acidimicrobiia bacterium]|nr:phage baseplate assembly protein V [Acidimicrobiia bacterium]
MTDSLWTVDVKVAGASLTAEFIDRLVDVRVEQSVHVPSAATLRFIDDYQTPDQSLMARMSTMKVGAEVEVVFNSENTTNSVLKGDVTSVGWDQVLAGDTTSDHELTVTVLDRRHRLAHGTQVRTFVNQSYKDVISTIAADCGLTVSVTPNGPLAATQEYLMQTTNNYDFIDRICALSGVAWWVSGTTLNIKPPSLTGTTHAIDYLVDLARFKTQFNSSPGDTSLAVRAVDPKTLAPIVGAAEAARTDVTSNASIGSSGRTDSASVNGDSVAHSIVADSAAEADGYGKGLASRVTGQQVVAKGELYDRADINVGDVLEIGNVPDAVAGKYFLTEVTCLFGRDRRVKTRFTSGGLRRDSLVDMLGGRPSAVGDFGQNGLVHAQVTNVDDEEGFGRVKVKYLGLSDDEESWWARVVSAGAGPNTGVQFMPHVNDHVIVGFEHGDYRRPIVLGGTWTSNDTLPNAGLIGDGKVKGWSIKSQSGHIFEIHDTDSDTPDTFIMNIGSGEMKTYWGKDKIVVECTNIPIELKNEKASITMTDAGDIELSGENVTIKATQKVDIEASGGDFKAKGQNATVEGAMKATLKGAAGADVDAGGAIANVKGSMVNIN